MVQWSIVGTQLDHLMRSAVSQKKSTNVVLMNTATSFCACGGEDKKSVNQRPINWSVLIVLVMEHRVLLVVFSQQTGHWYWCYVSLIIFRWEGEGAYPGGSDVRTVKELRKYHRKKLMVRQAGNFASGLWTTLQKRSCGYCVCRKQGSMPRTFLRFMEGIELHLQRAVCFGFWLLHFGQCVVVQVESNMWHCSWLPHFSHCVQCWHAQVKLFASAKVVDEFLLFALSSASVCELWHIGFGAIA